MRTIEVDTITENIREMCIEANHFLSADMRRALDHSVQAEKSPLGRQILEQLQENLQIAGEDMIPICQDTGMAVIFLEVGQDVHFEGGSLEEAVHEGVRRGYVEGYLRKSVVKDPLIRENTRDNTPAVIHYEIKPGDRVKITVAPKGFGSENMSRLKMFTPAATEQAIVEFVANTVKEAGGNPCPPVVLGVGIGGDFELCALLAKQALCRDVDQRNPNPYYAGLEAKMLEAVNATGIGPQGFGGDISCLAVNIEAYATHIAGLPVAVNVGCHVTRHCTVTL